MIASRHRPFIALLFALLLLGMQHQVQVHALQHLGSVLHPKHDPVLQTQIADASCVECALLAAGTSAIAGNHDAAPAVALIGERMHFAIATRRLAAPSYYSSRAPPLLV